MIKFIVSDLGEVLLFAKDKEYKGRLSDLHKQLASQPNYKPEKIFETNSDLLELLKSKADNVTLGIFTAGIMHTIPFIAQELSKVFSVILTDEIIGGSKKEVDTFVKLAKYLQVEPSEILFIDDTQQNVECAQKAGLQTIHYANLNQFENSLKQFI